MKSTAAPSIRRPTSQTLCHRLRLVAAAVLLTVVPTMGQVTITQSNPTGLYSAGETATVTIAPKDDAALKAMSNITARFRHHGATGGKYAGQAQPIDLSNGPVQLSVSLDEPATTILEVSWQRVEDGKNANALLGAAFDHTRIPPSAPRPDDFDAFWAEQIKLVSAIPLNPQIEPVAVDDPKIEYAKVRLDNIDGTHVYGQIARPKSQKDQRYPAMLLVQYAGVYPLPASNVIDPAKQGWIALNIMAHDLPFDLPKEQYDELSKTKLKNYALSGSQSRETSYFRRMFLGCYQATEFLSQQPDWNGEVILVRGGSQGGLQAIATAALHPKVTHVIAHVPAGCDVAQARIGRLAGWPGWAGWGSPKDADLANRAQSIETGRYYDPVNFAPKVKAKTLVTMGLVDTVSTPSGPLVLYNQLTCPKEIGIFPAADHQGLNRTFDGAWKMHNDWIKAAQKSTPPAGVN